MNTVEVEGKTYPRFYAEDSTTRINMVSVRDRQLKDQEAIEEISKPHGELACGLLNAAPHVPSDPQAYKQLVFKAKTSAGRIPSVVRCFEAGMHDGIFLGENANPDAGLYRTPAHNEAYKAGVVLGQRIAHQEVRVV